MNIVKQDLLNKKQFLKILWSEVWKGGFQLIQILDLLGMYFDAAVVEVKTYLLLFRLALAILWGQAFEAYKCNPTSPHYSPISIIKQKKIRQITKWIHEFISQFFLFWGNTSITHCTYARPRGSRLTSATRQFYKICPIFHVKTHFLSNLSHFTIYSLFYREIHQLRNVCWAKGSRPTSATRQVPTQDLHGTSTWMSVIALENPSSSGKKT